MQAVVLHVVGVVIRFEEVDDPLKINGTHNPAAIKSALALLDDLRRVLVGRIHGEALLEVGQRALLLILPVQGSTNAVIPHRVCHALCFNAAQQLDGVPDEFLEGIHVRLRVVNVGARQQASQLVVQRCWRIAFDERNDLLVFLFFMQSIDLRDEL